MSDGIYVWDDRTAGLMVPAERIENTIEARTWLKDHLLALWRHHSFERAVWMDVFMAVAPEQSIYCTRLVGNDGLILGCSGYDKGHVRHGGIVRNPDTGGTGYLTWEAFENGCKLAGFRVKEKNRDELREQGKTLMTTGTDNRLHWLMPLELGTCNLLASTGHKVRGWGVQEQQCPMPGDYLEVSDSIKNGYLSIKVETIHLKAHVERDWRWLYELS